MVIKVGINGFGRVGRVVLRTCLERPDIQIAAINDPAVEVDYICYLIKFDSTHGTLKHNVSYSENEIKIDDVRVKVFQQKLPPNIPWHTAGVQYVVEASGMFTSMDKASGHLLCDGVKRVIVTAPSVDVPMVILGVNENKIKPECKVISCGSSTLYCLAPIVKVLEDNYEVEEGFVTSIHAMTPSLKPLDGLCIRGKHWRDHRSITQNIIPAMTGACRALGRVVPSVRDKFCGLAFRVPIANVSVLDVTVRLKKPTSIEDIVSNVDKFNKLVKQTIITTSSDETVSSDFIGDSHSCILDIGSSLQLKSTSFKLVCWYENEYSYACRVVDLIYFSEDQFKNLTSLRNKTTFVRTKTYQKQDVDQQTENSSLGSMNKNIEDKINLTKIPKANPKPLQRPLLLKKPLTIPSPIPAIPLNRDSKKIELFKIWNNENEANKANMLVRQTPATFFQTCGKITPQTKNTVDCFKAQERLAIVKKEFTKMVSITEDLLRKSYTNKMRVNSLEQSKDELAGSSTSDVISENADSKPNLDETFKVTGTPKVNPAIFDASGDGNSVSTFNSKLYSDTSKEEVKYIHCDKGKSDYSFMNDNGIVTGPSSITSESLKGIRETKEHKDSNTQSANTAKFLIHPDPSCSNRNFISKTFTNIFDGFSRNFPFQSVTDKNVAEKDTEGQTNCDKEMKNELFVNKTETEKERDITQNNPTTVNDNIISKDLTTIQVLNVENIVLQQFSPAINVEKVTNTSDSNAIEADCKNTDNPDGKDLMVTVADETGEHIDNNVESIEEIKSANGDNSHDEKNLVGSYTLTPQSSAAAVDDQPGPCSPRYINKQDIFDKLDSTSASSSDNSFEVDARKSQVINICDLTNSLDDLDRLDKICRIMEISDELSNQLFSALDDGSCDTNATKKKWSFKDLCEKINLDEFSSALFGK